MENNKYDYWTRERLCEEALLRGGPFFLVTSENLNWLLFESVEDFQKYIDTCVDFNTFFYWFKHTEHIILYFDSEEDPERSGRQKYCRIQNYNMI